MEKFIFLFGIFLALATSGSCTDVYSRYDFPEGFVFGAGSSAYQWEGAVAEDGRTPSVWDTFCHSHFSENGDITSDGYHKYKEDVKLMVDTSLDVFRFSISWSRLIPNGRGPINLKGLQFYKNLIQELVSHGIEPHVTLYHYDHPQYLEDEYGGWLNHRIIKDFTAYADVCFREFGNHIKFWTTINEGNIFSIGGYNNGDVPPGRCSTTCVQGNSSTEPYIVGHNLLLAHASASRLYRQKYKDIQGGSVGFSIFTIGFAPGSSDDNAIEIQRANDFYIGWLLRPLIYGDYPDTMKKTLGSRMPVFSEEESEQVKGSSDFVGINHYLAASVTHIKPKPSVLGNQDFYSDMGVTLNFYANFSVPEFDIAPWGLESVLEYVKESYGNPPVYILESGTPIRQDSPLKQKDTPRVEFLRSYIAAVLRSIRDGSDTRGYFVWSFMDYYEIQGGYSNAYGMYSVNFSDPHRTRSPKLSAHWYSDFLNGKTVSLGTQGITKMQSNFSSST